MSKQILAINDNVHDQVQKLLPWFVVGTLRGEEQTLVNQHLNVCAECQADFSWQCKLQSIEPASDVTPDVDRAFAKLRQRIDAGSKRPADRPSWFRNLGQSWMPMALAAQLLLIIGLITFTVMPKESAVNYRALGASGNNNGNMVVVFNPETTEGDLRRLLNSAGARIVDGPTVTDAYLLQVADEKVNTTLATLRADHHVTVIEVLSKGGRQ